MSHRTSPVFHDWTLPLRPTSTKAEPAVNADQAAVTLFEALEQARFDQVRRAVSANPACLSSTSSDGLTPVDYALHHAHTWDALLEHCRRTGTAFPVPGHATPRERLVTISTIIGYLLAHPKVVPPIRAPLHIALSCKFDWLAEALIDRFPGMANTVDTRMKTPLHIICGLSGRFTTQTQARLTQILTRAGADANARDCEGRTPLHELVSSLSESAPPYGLVHRCHLRPSLGFAVATLDELLIAGADIYATDAKGSSPMHMALANGQDYLLIPQRADMMRERLCYSDFAMKCSSSKAGVTGLWGLLPDEVIARIFRMLSPRDVVCGIGATCFGLRRVAVSQDLWKHLEMHRSMAAIRNSVLRASLQNPTRA